MNQEDRDKKVRELLSDIDTNTLISYATTGYRIDKIYRYTLVHLKYKSASYSMIRLYWYDGFTTVHSDVVNVDNISAISLYLQIFTMITSHGVWDTANCGIFTRVWSKEVE